MASSVLWLLGIVLGASAWPYDSKQLEYNLNTNQEARSPSEYSGKWEGHNYTASPKNWRFSFYTLFLDRFVNGDPRNDDINGTVFENDVMSSSFRYGGDLAGLHDSLDYLQGMFVKGIYIAGTPYLNRPWKYDQYSPLDLTLLDYHSGTIKEWQQLVDEIRSRGMYLMLDLTGSTLADLIGVEQYLNQTAPFSPEEYDVIWKDTARNYSDFTFNNAYKDSCEYPRFWKVSGERVLKDSTDPIDANFSQLVGCYDSEFDQYGETEAFGSFPDWQRQLTKYASVQDRLREWLPAVREKISVFTCLLISQLDIGGVRFDKTTQMTPDALALMTADLRRCASSHGKDNFFIAGEISGGDQFGSIFVCRGREHHTYPEEVPTNYSNSSLFLRNESLQGLDAAAFHYSIRRSLTRFLGLDGNLEGIYDLPVDFVDSWNAMLLSNDLLNANTGELDPRHMYGATNQDVFRWPAIANGTERMLLGLFITTLLLPGVPLSYYGEEQAFYLLTDTNAANYLFGRQPMSSNMAWQLHGCFNLDTSASDYYQLPIDAAMKGCEDDLVGRDHRDPTHPVRNMIKAMYSLRDRYPILNDGLSLQALSKQTFSVQLLGSNGIVTETGMWSTVRSKMDFQQLDAGNQSVWLVYHNQDHAVTYKFDCTKNDTALIAPFAEGVTVRNLLAPYEELELQEGPETRRGVDGSEEFNGCLDEMTFDAWGFKAFVPRSAWTGSSSTLTAFLPGHDARLPSAAAVGLEFHFSAEMVCKDITDSITINSTTENKKMPEIDLDSVSCSAISQERNIPHGPYVPSVWSWKANLTNVEDGIHRISMRTPSLSTTTQDTIDHLMFRIGLPSNPMVFPHTANYSRTALQKVKGSKQLMVSHFASGADLWRYSTNFASSWSPWEEYKGGNSTVEELPWDGTRRQEWSQHHVILQYFSKIAGSSAHIQHADTNWSNKPPRWFPHLYAQGAYNQFGFDAGLPARLYQGASDGLSRFHLMTEWPTTLKLNMWGLNPDGKPDQGFVYGDANNDSVLDRVVPESFASTVLNFSVLPPPPHLAYQLRLHQGNLRYSFHPVGSRIIQIIVYSLLWVLPIVSATLGIWIYMGVFYKIKFNQIGVSKGASGILGMFRNRGAGFRPLDDQDQDINMTAVHSRNVSGSSAGGLVEKKAHRRCVLIATMEYDIEDWEIKIKIGGLGVMAQLMGKALGQQDLVWVVPCVGGIAYPVDVPADAMVVTVLGVQYEVQVQCHQLRNITYVLLDAPVFRQQTKAEPYPPRMDDLDSAIYYSAWNACIAETMKRFPVDIYHINDYHGAAAPLYLLPRTIPCCLSLHNAEFQGLWPIRTTEEQEEVCKTFNLSVEIVQKYIQFGEVFNLLHAGASYLRVHQKGFGAVGVSNKYGPRSYSRYPIFWGLKEIGKLPNPDPSDTEPWSREADDAANKVITVDQAYEASRGELRKQAQNWAGLIVDPTAELFVFVGRWSVQKGVDLIADVFPAVLAKHKTVQLICIGPVIDLHGKFAALKLEQIMKNYPGRVFSKPEFTQLPPYLFSGAEFALIPSRDEPFGLVAVEFGRKSAIGVGARVGGLGQMPGFWFTVESNTTKHMIHQFKSAVDDAIKSTTSVRAAMRARSAKQRFPVAQWVEDLEILQSAAIRIHKSERRKSRSRSPSPQRLAKLGASSDRLSTYEEDPGPSLQDVRMGGVGLERSLTLGTRVGPGHQVTDGGRHNDIWTELDQHAEVQISQEQAEAAFRNDEERQNLSRLEGRQKRPHAAARLDIGGEARGRSGAGTPRISVELPTAVEGRSFDFADDRSRSPSPAAGMKLLPSRAGSSARHASTTSMLSLNEVTHGRQDFNLQKVQLTFEDSQGEYYNKFQSMLEQTLNPKTSESTLVIEDFLKESGKEWAARYRDAQLGRSRSPGRKSYSGNSMHSRGDSSSDGGLAYAGPEANEFMLQKDYVKPSIVKRWMRTRIFDWPIYSFFLAIGQVIAANSYQIVLLTGGSSGNEAEKLYIVGGIFIIFSCIWWIVFRRMPSRWVLSLPFLFYGMTFIIVGLAPFIHAGVGRDWARNVATGLYAAASASGSLYFALNFGDEGGSPVESWIYRACLVQGTQQLYVAGLFYWAKTMSEAASAGETPQSMIANKPIMAAIACPIGAALLAVGGLLFTSLPSYYHQSPGKIPNFYQSLLRRKLIIWMLVSVVLSNYWLSAQYGRSWSYLWSSRYAPKWSIAILAVVFFVGVWTSLLLLFARLSKTHSWFLPMFAFGLLAPRWAQMWWGTSSFGLWLPWMAGGPIGGALAGRSLWLWLGVLDSIQGIGIGMALLQTLTRIHVAITLVASQIIGAAITMIAKASSPNKDGPGSVFPDLSEGVIAGMMQPWFWVALVSQLIIPIGFFIFFRKEQLTKP